jgi:predicted dehydrogenase
LIRTAVVGAGRWGPNLIRNFHNLRTSKVLWVVDQNPSRGSEISARFPEVQFTGDVGRALSDPNIDAAVIATPTATHFSLAKAALSQGKHVLVEKPIASSSSEAEELCALAARARRVLMVGHVFLFNTGIRRVKEYLDEDRLGRIYYVSMVRTNLGPVRRDVNAAWDLASHDISIANDWLGGLPVSATAVGGAWLNQGNEDTVFATLRYPGEVLVNLHASWLSPRKAREITLVGEQRMLTFSDMDLNEPVRIYDRRVADAETPPEYADSFASFRASIRDGDIVIPNVRLEEPLRAECDHFLHCISTGEIPMTNGRQGAEVVRVLEAVQRSLGNRGREETV